MYKLVWYSNPLDREIGCYRLCLKNDRGAIVPCSEIHLIDYTCDFRVREREARVFAEEDPIAFRWSWCHGWSHEDGFRYSSGKTLQDAMRQAEDWLLGYFDGLYCAALQRCTELEPLHGWIEQRRTEAIQNETV